jgi:membrane-bound inhibitor of C-type lysozyme
MSHYTLKLSDDNKTLTVNVLDEGKTSYSYTLLPDQTDRLNKGEATEGEIYAECELGYRYEEVSNV